MTVTRNSLLDRQRILARALDAATAEVARLGREEAYLMEQVRRAKEQVRYYEGLLVKLRRDWGKPTHLTDIVRRLG
jgi:hypothetical protein